MIKTRKNRNFKGITWSILTGLVLVSMLFSRFGVTSAFADGDDTPEVPATLVVVATDVEVGTGETNPVEPPLSDEEAVTEEAVVEEPAAEDANEEAVTEEAVVD